MISIVHGDIVKFIFREIVISIQKYIYTFKK